MNRAELMQKITDAGFPYSMDIVSKFECFERLLADEREECAKIAFNAKTYIEAAKAIRARGQG